MQQRLKPFLLTLLTALLGLAIALPVLAQTPWQDSALSMRQRLTLYQYAANTWLSFVAMTDPRTGLPANHVSADGTHAAHTSPTDIGTYLWSIVVARDLHLITPAQAHKRIGRVLDTLAGLERHTASGQFYNWYNPTTGEKLTLWPSTGATAYPFLSSVDNAWLATALLIVTHAVPSLRDKAQAILKSMDFSCYYDPNARGPDLGAGLMRGGFWTMEDTPPWVQNSPTGNYCGKVPNVTFTSHHFGTLNSETRIISYIAIALGQVPPAHYFALWRTFPATCDWGWQEMAPQGVMRTYLGIEVYEGYYTYRDKRLVPSWGVTCLKR